MKKTLTTSLCYIGASVSEGQNLIGVNLAPQALR